MITNFRTNLLDNFIISSSKLVVLQALKAEYLIETQAESKQETKNFRTTAILEEMRVILEFLEEFMEFFADVEEKQHRTLPPDQLQAIQKLMVDLGSYYTWAIEEIKMKEFRQSLLTRKL